MPAKKKEIKPEEPIFVDEKGTFIHEAECARYSGAIRRYNNPAAQQTVVQSSTSGKSGKGGGAAAAPAAAAGTSEEDAAQASGMRYRHGYGTYISPTLRYAGDWVEDAMHGKGHLELLTSGDVYDGEFVRGRFDGRGVYLWKNSSKYEGLWRENRMHGEGVYTDVSGNVWKGKYYNGTGPGLERAYKCIGVPDGASLATPSL